MNVILEIVQCEYASQYIYTYMCLYRYIASLLSLRSECIASTIYSACMFRCIVYSFV